MYLWLKISMTYEIIKFQKIEQQLLLGLGLGFVLLTLFIIYWAPFTIGGSPFGNKGL